MNLSRNAIIQASTHWLKIAREDKERSKKEKRFWSIAAEVYVAKNTWKAEVAQVFASDSTSALATYYMTQFHPVRIVGVAPTLGFWVEGNDETKLIA